MSCKIKSQIPDPPSKCHLRRCIQPHRPGDYVQYASGATASAPCIWHPAGDQEIGGIKYESTSYKIRRWIWARADWHSL